jgi:hypothetical protein
MHGPWHVVEIVVLIVLGIAALQALVWIPIIVRWRHKSRAAFAQLAAAIDSETVVRPPEKGVYRGATAPGYPVVSNNGRIALTERRLIFVTITGKIIEIPCTAIVGVHESKVFKASARGGNSHLVVQIPSGEIAFYVSSNVDWINAITTLESDRTG